MTDESPRRRTPRQRGERRDRRHEGVGAAIQQPFEIAEGAPVARRVCDPGGRPEGMCRVGPVVASDRLDRRDDLGKPAGRVVAASAFDVRL